jgi:hypothetical protein
MLSLEVPKSKLVSRLGLLMFSAQHCSWYLVSLIILSNLHNVITFNYGSHFLPTKVKLVVWTHYIVLPSPLGTSTIKYHINAQLQLVSDTKHHKGSSEVLIQHDNTTLCMFMASLVHMTRTILLYEL